MTEFEEGPPKNMRREDCVDLTDYEWGRIWAINERHRIHEYCHLGIRRDEDDPNKATEQTARKLKKNVIDKLYSRAKEDDDADRKAFIGEEHKNAADEILTVWEALGRNRFPGTRAKSDSSGTSFDFTRVDNSAGERDTILRMSDAELDKLAHYMEWMREVEAVKISCRRPPAYGHLTAAILTWDVVVNNSGVRQIEDEYGITHGTAIDWLQKSLWRYAEISGIAKPRKFIGTAIWGNKA